MGHNQRIGKGSDNAAVVLQHGGAFELGVVKWGRPTRIKDQARGMRAGDNPLRQFLDEDEQEAVKQSVEDAYQRDREKARHVSVGKCKQENQRVQS